MSRRWISRREKRRAKRQDAHGRQLAVAVVEAASAQPARLETLCVVRSAQREERSIRDRLRMRDAYEAVTGRRLMYDPDNPGQFVEISP